MPRSDFHTASLDNWTLQDLPLHIVLYEWFMKNMYIPTDLGTLVAYIGLFLITWYTIIWIVRVLMSVIWPLFIITSAIVVFRILQYYEPEEITAIMTKSFSIVADTLPTTQLVANILYASEKILVGSLMQILHLTNGISESVEDKEKEN